MPPAATVIIPTRNRKQVLLETIGSILQQSVSLELLVMDDGSTDGTAEAVQAAFPKEAYPQVAVHRAETSLGPTRRRNDGAALATTPYLFTIDDDLLMPSRNTFQQTIDAFDDPHIGAVTIPFINIHQDTRVQFVAPDTAHAYITGMFYGGMVAFRTAAYRAVGGYRTFYFMHVEEPDLCVRLMEHGYLTRLGTADPIHHLESPLRNKRRLNALAVRNSILYHWYNTPWPAAAVRMPGAAALAWAKSTRAGYPHLASWGLLRGIRAVLHETGRRQPVRPIVHQLSRSLKVTPLPLPQVVAALSARSVQEPAHAVAG